MVDIDPILQVVDYPHASPRPDRQHGPVKPGVGLLGRADMTSLVGCEVPASILDEEVILPQKEGRGPASSEGAFLFDENLR